MIHLLMTDDGVLHTLFINDVLDLIVVENPLLELNFSVAVL